jgi:hypothetical protein
MAYDGTVTAGGVRKTLTQFAPGANYWMLGVACANIACSYRDSWCSTRAVASFAFLLPCSICCGELGVHGGAPSAMRFCICSRVVGGRRLPVHVLDPAVWPDGGAFKVGDVAVGKGWRVGHGSVLVGHFGGSKVKCIRLFGGS